MEQKNNSKNKVIPFPNLKERYLEKGMDFLKEKKFHDALAMFSEAKDINEEESEVLLGMAICYMELGELIEAKNICKKMLLEDIGHYFTVLQIYLTILIQLREYQEVQSTIEAVLEENHLPAESAEHFYKLLEFSRKMTEDEGNIVEESEHEEINTFNSLENPNNQITFIQSLRDRNISKHFRTLVSLLENDATHPIVKTMILHLMFENEVEKEVSVTKFGETIQVIPAKLEDINEQMFTKKVLSLLDDTLGNENPTLFEAVKELWIRHLYVLYPLLPKPTEAKIWAAALHVVGYELHGITIEEEEILSIYDCPSTLIEDACKKIYEIEEISYLQI
ncbi:tetratricopeptide repeat protein [Metabacillus niabensis]|uniref:Tetratricopeptide (TPR) repeat protein n=1 Tax=Metabacillus niabensis TaxID=324854 RepID=A0ABT9YZG0_9BACI|nr:tetratricopeptide repeat protein [Metabacillus niabensis]MDQ0224688.1 tetratricopeptide (TPR) repeat protein [Metabacillus niabensis]